MYLWNGSIPELPHEGSRYTPVLAAETKDVWTRTHDLEDLMQLVNPEGGYVQNCNSPPYLTNLNAPLNREDFPTYFPDNDLSLRAQKGVDIVHNNRRFSLEEMVDEKYSNQLFLADRVKPDLLRLLDAADLSDDEKGAVDMLRAWDNTASAESVGSVLFKVWWEHYRKGENSFAEVWSEDKPVTTPQGIGAPERAVTAFHVALKETVERWASWDVKWGDVHRLRRGDLDLPIGGASWRLGCFRVMHYEEADDGKLIANGGDGFVFAVEFDDTPKAYSVLAYSQSDRPESKHYNDQAALFVNHKMKPTAFTEEAIESSLIRAYHPGQ